MSSDAPSIIDQAIAWHLRQDAMAAEEWPLFVAWLEAAPDHARAYDVVAASGELVAAATFPRPSPAANDDGPVRRRTWRIVGGTAIAAALAAWFVPLVFAPSHAPGAAQVFATRDGEHRDVRLGDGTMMAMNGDTRVQVAADDPRALTLDQGQVTLKVVHDASHPFTLRSGGQVIRDLGTTFDVAQDDGGLTVAVAEGSVAFQPDAADHGGEVTLKAGQGLSYSRDGRIIRRDVASNMVGGWRQGLLSFDGIPLSKVAASLRRLQGLDLVLSGDLSRRPFTGMIHVTGAADRDVPHLADLIGANWRRDGKSWILAERATAP